MLAGSYAATAAPLPMGTVKSPTPEFKAARPTRSTDASHAAETAV